MLRTTGAVREFTDEPVTDDVLYRILETARFAPSGGNRQGAHVTVVRERVDRAAGDHTDAVEVLVGGRHRPEVHADHEDRRGGQQRGAEPVGDVRRGDRLVRDGGRRDRVPRDLARDPLGRVPTGTRL